MTRQAVADALKAVLPDDVAIYLSPPSALAAPCAVIKLKAATQHGPCQWHQVLGVTLVAPGGDNEAALLWLEDHLVISADALSKTFAQAIGWAEPGQAASGNQTYLAADMEVTVDVFATETVKMEGRRHASQKRSAG